VQARIDEEQIRTLVMTFYGRVRADTVLGPIFEERLAGRWDPHLEKMCDFWSSILLATGRYRGNPIAVHAQIPEMTSSTLDLWMTLFRTTCTETLPEPIATDVAARGARMRVVLERNGPVAATLEPRSS